MTLSSELFLSAYTDYLQEIIDKSLNHASETRVITQSLMPSQVLAIFEHLSLIYPKTDGFTSYFRVAHGLVSHWKSLSLTSNDQQAFDKLKENLWLDEDDKLTWYRNRTSIDENVEKLLVLLVGIDHTTDKGGLADFFVCSSDKVWRSLNNDYIIWLRKIASKEDLVLGEKHYNELNEYLVLINSIVPLTLSQKAQLLETWINNYLNDSSYSEDYNSLLSSLLASLMYLGIPYLRIDEDIKLFRSKKGHLYLKNAHKFISHTLYNQGNRKNKDLDKVRKFLDNSTEITILDYANNRVDRNDYLKNVESFILNADNDSKTRLIQTDLMPILKALNIKEEKDDSKSSTTIPIFSCGSFEAICKGLNFALDKFNKEHQIETVTHVTTRVKHFQHDFNDKHAKSDNLNKDQLAKSVLQGVLGGIEHYVNKIELPSSMSSSLEFIPIDQGTTYRSSTSNPHVVFEVIVTGEETEIYLFKWKLSEFQTERLHFQIAKTILHKLDNFQGSYLLPLFVMPKQVYQAVYHASNQEEACRLMSLGLSDIKVIDLFEGYEFSHSQHIKEALHALKTSYYNLLSCVVNNGMYVARKNSQDILGAYNLALDKIMNSDSFMIQDIKERFYYALFTTEELHSTSLSTINGVLVNAYHPAVFELVSAQTDFIVSAVSDIYEKSDNPFSRDLLDPIFIQSEIESPILALKQKQGISTHSKPFGWLHYVGDPLNDEIDLSVQALLQETDDDEDTHEVHNVIPEEKIVFNTLNDYQKVYFHATDGLRILATNVSNLSSLLSGITKYCQHAIIGDNSRTHYSLHIAVYTVGLSKLSAVNSLKHWQESLVDKFSKKDKTLNIKISHFNSDADSLLSELNSILEHHNENQLGRYDITFNFNFLKNRTYGKTDPAPNISLDFSESSGRNLIFPIIYYPKPIIIQNDNLRELRLSQRRISIQSKHANLTANLEVSNRSEDQEYFVISKMEYNPEDVQLIETMHNIAQWVVTIDEYFDYNLLKKAPDHQHKVISFSSGYGHYGELNVTLSTAHQAPQRLKDSVFSHLSGIMHYLHLETLPQLVDEILKLNETLSGVASVKAVLGNNEALRNLYGYALSMTAIPIPENSVMGQWIPLDACQHWFKLQETSDRADLLQLSLTLGDNNKPTIHAHVVEAKVGSPELLKKAEDQIESTILYLSKVFSPKDISDKSFSYNRRYWWGQLHRALVSRAHVSQIESEQLNVALERLSEGDFDIFWTSSVVICHTEDNSLEPILSEGYYIDEHGNLDANSRKYNIHQYTESSFERALLSDVNWDEVSKSNPKYAVDNTESVQNINELIDSSLNNTNTSDIDKQPTLTSSIDVYEDHNNSRDNTPTEEPFEEMGSTLNSTNNSIVVKDRPILVGTEGQRQSPVYWEYNHSKLSNRHLLIFGSSGSGKTYAIQCLLAELAISGISSFIIDYTDGFLRHQSEPVYQKICDPQEYFVITKPLPINPFKSYTTEIAPGVVVKEQPIHVAIRVNNILSSVYTDFGSQQVAVIDKVLEAGLNSNSNYNLQDFIEDLIQEGTRGEGIANKISTLVKMNCFDSQADTNLYESEMRQKHAVQIIQLTQIPKNLQRMITEFILWDLWAYVLKHGNKDNPITIVLDEMQNLDHGTDSPIDKFLREGRKFGISLVLATQTVSSFTSEQKDRLFQASTKLFFKPATTEISSFADLLSKVSTSFTKNDWIEQLNSLEKGQCFFVGSVEDNNGGFKEVVKKLNITSLEDRNFAI